MDHATTELRDRWLAGEFSASETIASRMGTDTLIDFATRGLAACCNAVPSHSVETFSDQCNIMARWIKRLAMNQGGE